MGRFFGGTAVVVKLSLVVTQGPLAGRRFRLLQDGIYVFGRDTGLPGFLGEDDYLSGQHFEIELGDCKALLRDVGSRNGSRLNGRRLKPTRFVLRPDGSTGLAPDNEGDEILLNDGDTIFAGATVLSVSIESGPTCSECGAEIAPSTEDDHRWLAGAYLCSACRADMLERDDTEVHRAQEHERGTMTLGPELDRSDAAARDEVVTCARCGVPFRPGAPPPSGRPLLPVCPGCSGTSGVLLHELEASLREERPCGYAELEAALKAAHLPPTPGAAPSELADGAGTGTGRDHPIGEFSFAVAKNASTDEPPAALTEGATLDDFELGTRLERGGPGELRRAVRRSSSESVTLRLIDAPAANLEVGGRFVRAFAPWLADEHPHLASARDVGCAPGRVFVASDFAAGRTLPRFANVQDAPLGLEEIFEIGRQVLGALEALHEAGRVHGELRPDAVLVVDGPEGLDVRVTDAGIMVTLMTCGLLGRETWRPFLPMLPWMAPELAADPSAASPASDLYAAGSLLYQVLTEQPPRALPAVLVDPSRVLREVPVTPLRWHRTDLPKRLEDFLERALARDPNDRFASAREMADHLESTLVARA